MIIFASLAAPSEAIKEGVDSETIVKKYYEDFI